MASHTEIFDSLSKLLDYPGERTTAEAYRCRQLLHAEHPETETAITDFYNQIEALTVDDQQDLFIRTFDINPICALEVGWQLFGEHYTRGEFLVWMRIELRSKGIAESTELPDHLTHVLNLIGRMDEEESGAFIANYALPGVTKMLDGFKDNSNPFFVLLTAIKAMLHQVVGEETEVA